MNTMHSNICDWLCESSPTLSEDDNELDTGFCGQLNCGLKLEEPFEFAPSEHLMHTSPFNRDEMNLSLNSNCNRRPKLESTVGQADFEFQNTVAQQNTPDAQMDIYRDLILRHLIQDIATTCTKLSLPSDPNLWTSENVNCWVHEMCEQFNIPVPSKLNISGQKMMEMSQEEFCAHISEGADTLYAQFQLWKTAFESHNQQKSQVRQPNLGTSIALINKTNNWDANTTDSEAAAAATLHEHMTNVMNNSPMMPTDHQQPSFYPTFTPTHPANNYSPSMVHQQSAHHTNFYPQNHSFQHADTNYYSDYVNSNVLASPSESDISSDSSMNGDDPVDVRFMSFEQQNRLAYENSLQNVPYLEMNYDGSVLIPQNSMPCNPQHVNGVPSFSNLQNATSKLNAYSSNTMPFAKSNSGSIHLWHFIRELLDQPKEYAHCVRWVDRKEGTFKIESSHVLAKYWGQRKNRNAMNYDKLSRSLRQYYKKGIIQKPEKKQRLVYKFLPPYNH